MADAIEEWEANSEGFRFEPPDGPPEAWSQADYTRLFDRIISRRVEWQCQTCSKPFTSLERARSHVENTHADRLIDEAVARQNGGAGR